MRALITTMELVKKWFSIHILNYMKDIQSADALKMPRRIMKALQNDVGRH